MTVDDLTRYLGLHQPGQRVLIVEDALSALRRLSRHWAAADHRVTSVVGIRGIDDGVAIGVAEDLETEIPITLAEVQVAFLDHYFLSSRHNGVSLTQALRAAGPAKIMAMSSDPGANVRMQAAGADLGLRKSQLLALFPEG